MSFNCWLHLELLFDYRGIRIKAHLALINHSKDHRVIWVDNKFHHLRIMEIHSSRSNLPNKDMGTVRLSSLLMDTTVVVCLPLALCLLIWVHHTSNLHNSSNRLVSHLKWIWMEIFGLKLRLEMASHITIMPKPERQLGQNLKVQQ